MDLESRVDALPFIDHDLDHEVGPEVNSPVHPQLDSGEIAWWRDAVVYQIYVRSFADGDGDGTGDLAGVRSRLDHLRRLGVDAVWFNPWYPSPMADSGYDISDYRSIDPTFGTLAEAETLIAEAQAVGIRTIVDIVPNHVSSEHRWFQAALQSEPGSPERARFWFRPGGGRDGDMPPNGWQSIFGGPAWTRTKKDDGSSGEWYLHLFAPEQPDLNWSNPDVRSEHEAVLRFWFDREVAGFRIDSAALLVKDPELAEEMVPPGPGEHPFTDRDCVHEVYRQWRAMADSYTDPRVLVGEVWLPDSHRLARYLRPDELHTVFNFAYLSCPWEATALRDSITDALATHRLVDAPATWVLSNHDVTRPVTRYGRQDTSFSFDSRRSGIPTDLELGTRRARAAALLTMALPGSMYIYQGEELGLPEVEDIPEQRRQDPIYHRSAGVNPGRDGCRVPIPWSGDKSPYGFSPRPAARRPWLDPPDNWAGLTVAAQDADPDSMLSLYRNGLRIRRQEAGLAGSDLDWIPSGAAILAFRRGAGLACMVNLGPDEEPLPPGAVVVLASQGFVGRYLPPDTTVWIRLPAHG